MSAENSPDAVMVARTISRTTGKSVFLWIGDGLIPDEISAAAVSLLKRNRGDCAVVHASEAKQIVAPIMRSLLLLAVLASTAFADPTPFQFATKPFLGVASDPSLIRIDLREFAFDFDFSTPRRDSEVRIDNLAPGLPLPNTWTIDASNADQYILGGWQTFADAYTPFGLAVWAADNPDNYSAGSWYPLPHFSFEPTHLVVNLSRLDDLIGFDWTLHGLHDPPPPEVPEPASFALLLMGCVHLSLRRKRQ